VNKVARHLREMSLELQAFAQRRYPSFVTARSGDLERDDVPVFVYHSFEPSLFEAQLAYLAANHYRTVTVDEFHSHLSAAMRLPEKSVLLTIDDGRSSVWTYAYPLLKKYKFTATVFLIPGYTKEETDYRPNLDDYWSKKASREQVSDRDKSAHPLLTWTEIVAMHNSGVIDFQSHSLYHHKIFTGPRIVDFFGPDSDQPLYDLPLPYQCEGTFQWGRREEFFGMPIYANQPLLSGQVRYLDDDELRYECMNFAQRSDWIKTTAQQTKAALFRLTQKYRSTHGLRGRRATPRERDAEVLDNFKQSKRLIDERLNKEVRHFCYPYGVGSPVAVSMAKEAGYATNFWTTLKNRRTNLPGDDPFYCTRVKNDFIFRLPGEGRKSLRDIFTLKLQRRVRGEAVY